MEKTINTKLSILIKKENFKFFLFHELVQCYILRNIKLTYHNFIIAVPPLRPSVQGYLQWIPIKSKIIIRKFFIVRAYSHQAKMGTKGKKIKEQAKVIKD